MPEIYEYENVTGYPFFGEEKIDPYKDGYVNPGEEEDSLCCKCGCHCDLFSETFYQRESMEFDLADNRVWNLVSGTLPEIQEVELGDIGSGFIQLDEAVELEAEYEVSSYNNFCIGLVIEYNTNPGYGPILTPGQFFDITLGSVDSNDGFIRIETISSEDFHEGGLSPSISALYDSSAGGNYIIASIYNSEGERVANTFSMLLAANFFAGVNDITLGQISLAAFISPGRITLGIPNAITGSATDYPTSEEEDVDNGPMNLISGIDANEIDSLSTGKIGIRSSGGMIDGSFVVRQIRTSNLYHAEDRPNCQRHMPGFMRILGDSISPPPSFHCKLEGTLSFYERTAFNNGFGTVTYGDWVHVDFSDGYILVEGDVKNPLVISTTHATTRAIYYASIPIDPVASTTSPDHRWYFRMNGAVVYEEAGDMLSLRLLLNSGPTNFTDARPGGDPPSSSVISNRYLHGISNMNQLIPNIGNRSVYMGALPNMDTLSIVQSGETFDPDTYLPTVPGFIGGWVGMRYQRVVHFSWEINVGA